jgi:hypothetical protein
VAEGLHKRLHLLTSLQHASWTVAALNALARGGTHLAIEPQHLLTDLEKRVNFLKTDLMSSPHKL